MLRRAIKRHAQSNKVICRARRTLRAIAARSRPDPIAPSLDDFICSGNASYAWTIFCVKLFRGHTDHSVRILIASANDEVVFAGTSAQDCASRACVSTGFVLATIRWQTIGPPGNGRRGDPASLLRRHAPRVRRMDAGGINSIHAEPCLGRRNRSSCCRGATQNKNGLHKCKPLNCLVAGEGFEPSTFGL